MSAHAKWRHPVISGLGFSDIGRRLTRSRYQLTLDAVLAAIADAGLQTADIDGLACFPGGAVELNPGFNGPDLYEVMDGLGLELNWHLATSQGPAQFMSVIAAATAVSAGLCRHAVVFRTTTESSAQGSQGRQGIGTPGTEGVLSGLLASGAVSPANWTAFYARRHMHQYGTTREHLGAVAVTQRSYAALNPRAVLREPMSMQDYLEARTISTPLGLFDCDMPIDGSIAIVVSAPDTVSDLKRWATIDAVGTAMRHRPYWEHWPDLTTMAAHDAAHHMWSQTTLRPADVDVAQVYDAFSPFVIFWMEAMGFCGRGEGGYFVENGTRIGPGGSLPTNTWGGQLSGGRLHGWGFLAEALQQLWGTADLRQVPGAEVVAIGAGGGAAASAMLLTRGSA